MSVYIRIGVNFVLGASLLAWSAHSILQGCYVLPNRCAGTIGWAGWLVAVAGFLLILTSILRIAILVLDPGKTNVKNDGHAHVPEFDPALENRIAKIRQRSVTSAASQNVPRAHPEPRATAATPAEPAIVPFQTLVDAFSRPALALYRPYPAYTAPPCRSRFGGLPDLPAGVDWPHTISEGPHHDIGVPLHFMAQIDLSEMPWLPDIMPKVGTLLFFARIDEEMLWGDSDPRNDVRVLYDAASIGRAVAPPGTIRPIEGGYNHQDREFGFDGAPATTVYPAWPLVGIPIISMPDPDAIAPNLVHVPEFKGYRQALCEFRAEQISTATGVPLDTEPEAPDYPIYAVDTKDRTSLASSSETGFPWAPCIMSLTLRALAKTTAHAPLPADFGPELTFWLKTADALPPSSRIAPSLAEEFTAWLNGVLAFPELGLYRSSVKNAIRAAIRQAVVRSGADAALAALIPDDIYATAMTDHTPVRLKDSRVPVKDGETPVWQTFHHQMFGHVPSSQSPASVDFPDICLLQLFSDYGTNLMLCDVGEANFWISPEALAARDFDRVWGDTCGG